MSYLRRELGWPLNELGRIRLHKGDLAGAEEALLAAHRAGWDPQPVLALVRLAQGDADAAAASIRDALERPLRVPSKERPPNTALQRAPLLEAQVEIEIAVGDLDRARSAADELELVAARFESKALVAGAALARGRVRLAEGDSAGAEQSLSDAVRLWNDVGAPYEAAIARLCLAEAHGASGSEQRAELERHAARTILDEIEAARRVGPMHDAGDEPSTLAGNVFRREGDYWLVVFDDRTARIRDLKGMRYLARLLAVPGRELHVLDLVAAEAGAVRHRCRRCRRDPRRPCQGGVPPPSRRDRRGHRGGAGSRGRRTGGAGRLGTRLPSSRAVTRGRPGWPRSTSRVSVGARPSRRHPSDSPGHGPDRRAPSAARRAPRTNDPHRHVLCLPTRPSHPHRVERLIAHHRFFGRAGASRAATRVSTQ